MNIKVIVYSTPGCIQCQLTKRALTDKGIDFEPVDLSENPDALAYVTEDLGYTQAPVVVVDDQDHWSGFRPDMIGRLVGA